MGCIKMNDIFEQINNDFKEFISKWESQLEKMKSGTPSGMRKFTITFNGKEENWYLSGEEMKHEAAMAFIEKEGKQAPKLVDILEEDASGKTRLQLLSEVGANDCAWCKDSPFGYSYLAFVVGLSWGLVYNESRGFKNLAICHD